MHRKQRPGVSVREGLSGLESSSALFALYRTPTILKAASSEVGLCGEGPFFSSLFRQTALSHPCVRIRKHWLMIVTHVLSNNLSVLGEISDRLTGATDDTI